MSTIDDPQSPAAPRSAAPRPAAPRAAAPGAGAPGSAAPRPGERARDRAPWASVTACPDGPLLVRGDVELLLGSGRPADRRRSTVALCRCGASGIKPFCDGSHKVVGFTTDDEPT